MYYEKNRSQPLIFCFSRMCVHAFEKNNDYPNYLELLIGSIRNSTAEPIKLALINQLGKVAEPFVTLAPTEEIKGLVFEPQNGQF